MNRINWGVVIPMGMVAGGVGLIWGAVAAGVVLMAFGVLAFWAHVAN